MEQTENTKPKRKAKSIDRAVISNELKLKLDGFKKQINEQLGDFIKLNYSDLVNLILGVHADELSADEINHIRQNKYDEGRFIKWAYQEYIAAQARGETITLEELMAQQRGLNAKLTPAKSKRGRKRKQAANTDNTEPLENTTEIL